MRPIRRSDRLSSIGTGEPDRGTLDKIARDLRVAPADRDTLVHQGTHAADKLSTLLKVLGIGDARHGAGLQPMRTEGSVQQRY